LEICGCAYVIFVGGALADRIRKIKNFTGIFFLLAAVGAFVLIAMQAVTTDIWYDEVFSVGFMDKTIAQICSLTARDVHPPFYYIYLKIIVAALGSVPGVKAVVAAKIASLLPWIGLLIISLTYVRKRFGIFPAGIFLFLITAMPQLGTYYLEIRMYSLALLTITGAFIVSLEIVSRAGDNSNSFFLWMLLWILGTITAYMQYYACVAIVALYIILGIYLLLTKRYTELKYEIISAVASAIIYIPWLPSLYRQMTTISGNYWIQPLTLRSVFGCVKFITLPVLPYSKLPYVSVGLFIMAVVIEVILWICAFKKGKGEELYAVFGGVGIIFFVILLGFILSMLGTPIFTYRYMIPCLGALYLGLAILLDRVSAKEWMFILLIPIVLEGYLSLKGLYAEEHNKVINTPITMEALSDIPKGSIIITNFDHVTSLMSYYLPENDIYLYEADTDPLIPVMYTNYKGMIEKSDISKMVEGNENVYFFGSFNSREEIIEDWAKDGVNSEEINSCLLERYWFNIYRLSVE